MSHSRAHEVCATKDDVFARPLHFLIDPLFRKKTSVAPQNSKVSCHGQINMFDVTHVLVPPRHTQARKQGIR